MIMEFSEYDLGLIMLTVVMSVKLLFGNNINLLNVGYAVNPLSVALSLCIEYKIKITQNNNLTITNTIG